MLPGGLRSIRSWMVVYAAFIAAIVFAEHGMAMMFPERGNVSPVIVDAQAPAIRTAPLVRRLDI